MFQGTQAQSKHRAGSNLIGANQNNNLDTLPGISIYRVQPSSGLQSLSAAGCRDSPVDLLQLSCVSIKYLDSLADAVAFFNSLALPFLPAPSERTGERAGAAVPRWVGLCFPEDLLDTPPAAANVYNEDACIAGIARVLASAAGSLLHLQALSLPTSTTGAAAAAEADPFSFTIGFASPAAGILAPLFLRYGDRDCIIHLIGSDTTCDSGPEIPRMQSADDQVRRNVEA
jgi:hypothetical protein